MGGQASHWMVLGGSGGIGREIVRQVAPDCAFLDIAGRSRSKVRDALNEARLEGCRARGYAVNLGSLFSLQRMLKWAMRGALPDVVVMAYGPLVEKEMGATTDKDWQKMAMHNLA
ncbi:MAG: SDR family NAD(P)-dependent oxidoreductase, partial [Spirochaetaceae bacterium]